MMKKIRFKILIFFPFSFMRWRCLSLACTLALPRRYEWLYLNHKREIGLLFGFACALVRCTPYPDIIYVCVTSLLYRLFCRDGQMHKDVDLKIPRGARSGTRVVIPDMVDPGIANVAPGDLVFILKVTFEPYSASHQVNSPYPNHESPPPLSSFSHVFLHQSITSSLRLHNSFCRFQ